MVYGLWSIPKRYYGARNMISHVGGSLPKRPCSCTSQGRRILGGIREHTPSCVFLEEASLLASWV